MDDLRLPILAAVALATGPWMFWRGFRLLRTLQLVENTPTARIGSMAMGLVEVHGAVRGRSWHTAPFSGRPCAYWQVDVSVRGRNRASWSVVHRNESGSPFFLQDESGVALVYPHGAECRLRHGTEEECFGLNLPAPYADYLREHPSFVLPLARLSYMRFRERILEEGQQVYVLGTATPRGRVFVVSEGEALVATGTGGLGDAQRGGLDHEVVAVVRRGENERTFIISQEQEHELTMGLKLRMAGLILGGPVMALFGLGYWLLALASGRWPH
jgi:hypothetical protein